MTTENWVDKKSALLEGLDGKKRDVTAQLLENQRKHLTETAASTSTATGNISRYEKIFMPLIRRTAPATIAMELVGVQPLAMPQGVVFTQRFRYSNNLSATGGPVANAEASGVNLYEKYSLIASGEAYTASDARTNAQITAALEAQGGYEMNLEIVKKTVETKTRKLQAKWTLEADQDSRAMHGLDIESEMIAALSDEIVREQDREIITDLTALAGTVKSFDFTTADGRYASEKYTALTIGMSDLSNQIAVKTKRGGASWAIVSPDILVALRHANNGAFTPTSASGDVVASTTLFVGTLNGSIRVYVDINASTNTILMGYKGASEVDTGYVYSPYIPLMASNVITDPSTYDPQVGLMTRYALTSFTDANTDLGNSADYYARATVSNLSLGF